MQDVGGFADALEGCDVVFHTAAYFREYYAPGDHWPKLQAINVKGSLDLAEAAHTRGVRRFLDVSSSGTVGLKADGAPGDEDTAPAPVSHANLYFKSKLLAEQELRAFSARTGMDVVFILPGWMFGPSDAAPTGSGQLVLDFLARKLPALPPGGSSVADARDVAEGMVVAAEQGRSGERYILGGEFVDFDRIAKGLEQASGVPAPRWHIPYPVAFVAAAASETWARLMRGSTVMTVEGVRAMNARLQVDSSKAKRELGATFRPLEETLRDEVAWYRERQAKAGEARGPEAAAAPV
jgi:dihydroflavonol-4-reductase